MRHRANSDFGKAFRAKKFSMWATSPYTNRSHSPIADCNGGQIVSRRHVTWKTSLPMNHRVIFWSEPQHTRCIAKPKLLYSSWQESFSIRPMKFCGEVFKPLIPV